MLARSESDRVVPFGRGGCQACGTEDIVDTMSGTGGDDIKRGLLLVGYG